jgi:hypothetical protein
MPCNDWPPVSGWCVLLSMIRCCWLSISLVWSTNRKAFFTRMAGHFGLAGTNNDSTPIARLLLAYPSLDVHELARSGALVDGAVMVFKIPDGGSRFARHEAGKFQIDDQAISIRSHPFLRMPVFVCPLCSADRYRLHLIGGVWACRDCQKRRHHVDYACRHTQRSVPAWHRIGWLRRRIGADPRLFTPLPIKSLRHHRYWRLAREIRALERRLIAHGENIANVLENRHGRS